MTAKPTAVFRFDASPAIGGGHAMRSGALAAALAGEGWRTICATQEETIETVPGVLDQFDDVRRLDSREAGEIDEIASGVGGPFEAVVLDHYGRDRAFDRACRRIASCVTVVEDRPEVLHDCDILVNPSIQTDREPPGNSRYDSLLGPRYALLRPSFRESRERTALNREYGSLLLLCGYTDNQNLTERLFDALDGAPGMRTVHVVLGAANAHRDRLQRRLRRAVAPVHLHVDPSPITDLMSRAALAVTAAGSTCWELACLGVPMVTVVTAANQIPVDRTLREAGASAGTADDALDTRLRATVVELMADDTRRRRMAACGRELVDGYGAARVAQAIGARALSHDS